MLQIPRRVEYALRAVLTLARAPKDARLSFKDIADCEDIPRDYLAKILRTLVDADLVESKRGANGGYKLARPAEALSFLEVIEAADSPVAVNLCTEFGNGCDRSNDCALASVWQTAENAMRQVFAATTIADVLRSPLTFDRLAGSAATEAAKVDQPCADL